MNLRIGLDRRPPVLRIVPKTGQHGIGGPLLWGSPRSDTIIATIVAGSSLKATVPAAVQPRMCPADDPLGLSGRPCPMGDFDMVVAVGEPIFAGSTAWILVHRVENPSGRSISFPTALLRITLERVRGVWTVTSVEGLQVSL
jgi:hypothetical protein